MSAAACPSMSFCPAPVPDLHQLTSRGGRKDRDLAPVNWEPRRDDDRAKAMSYGTTIKMAIARTRHMSGISARSFFQLRGCLMGLNRYACIASTHHSRLPTPEAASRQSATHRNGACLSAPLNEYITLRRRVVVAADQLIAVGEALHADVLPARSARQHLEEEGRFRVLVLGEFSRGKSTFINALIRARLLPAAVTSCTATLNILRGGPTRAGTIHYRDSARPTRVVDLTGNDPDKTLRTVVTKKAEDAEAIAKVEISWPGRLEATMVEIVDTPGVNDIDQQREEITYSFLPRADAAILLLDCQQPFNGTERRFLAEKILGNDIQKLFFVVNKIDQLGGATNIARVLEHVRTETSKVVKQPRVFGVASKPWLQAQLDATQPATATGFEAFEDELYAFLAQASGAAKLQAPVRRLDRFAQGLAARMAELRKRLLGDHTVLAKQMEQKRDEVRALSQAKASAERTLDVHAARLQSEVLTECQVAMNRLQERGLGALRDGSRPAEARKDGMRRPVLHAEHIVHPD